MIVCNTLKDLTNATNTSDAAGAVAVKEYVAANGSSLTPSSIVTVDEETTTLESYIADVAAENLELTSTTPVDDTTLEAYVEEVVAEAIETETVTLESDYTTIYLKKTGNVVQLNIDAISDATFTAWTETILAAIPEGYRPAAIVYCYDTMTGSYVRANGVVKIYTTGNIGLTYATAQTALQALSITYII